MHLFVGGLINGKGSVKLFQTLQKEKLFWSFITTKFPWGWSHTAPLSSSQQPLSHLQLSHEKNIYGHAFKRRAYWSNLFRKLSGLSYPHWQCRKGIVNIALKSDSHLHLCYLLHWESLKMMRNAFFHLKRSFCF